MSVVMAIRLAGTVAALTIALSASTALADGPVGSDPSSNFPVGALPSACDTDPTGSVCIDASVNYLNRARASLGQPAYALPSNFTSLSPPEQTLVLTNLDRTLYGLPAVPGLTSTLDQDAASGVVGDADPTPSAPGWSAYTSNWAGGYDNVVLAYEAWMYDDGYGSGNYDCTSPTASGCWGHRHDILWQFGGSGPLAMGAAAGNDSSGSPSYAMLLVEDQPGSAPVYTYTWAQAVAAGAGGSAGAGPGAGGASNGAGGSSSGSGGIPAAHGARAGLMIQRLRIRGHRVTVLIAGPSGAHMRCSLIGRTSRGGRIRRAQLCGRRAVFSRLPAGRYSVRVTSAGGTASRRVTIG